MKGYLKCPNFCFNGKEKHTPYEHKALFDFIKCRFCNGKGYVLKEKYNEINKLI